MRTRLTARPCLVIVLAVPAVAQEHAQPRQCADAGKIWRPAS